MRRRTYSAASQYFRSSSKSIVKYERENVPQLFAEKGNVDNAKLFAISRVASEVVQEFRMLCFGG